MFTLKTSDGKARRGSLNLLHGRVETPIFMPVGTVGSVKTLLPEDLKTLRAEIILGNTYHLFLRPGMDVIRAAGDLHRFIAWDRPILTDSGGYQVFSLGSNVRLTEEGAAFASHLDGRKFMLTPEDAVEIQETLGSDIQMVLDECTPYPATHAVAEKSLGRTLRWARRAKAARKRQDLCQFGIVQGGVYPDLRRRSAAELVDIGFDGYAIGGLSVGESKEELRNMSEISCEALPQDKPRYLMGVGTPLDIAEAVGVGVDMFDCVMPTRNARNGALFTSQGRVNMKNQQHRFSKEPLDPECGCYTCKTFTRSYLRHLYVAGELSALRLFTLHNLTFYLDFIHRIRAAIEAGEYAEFLAQQREIWDR